MRRVKTYSYAKLRARVPLFNTTPIVHGFASKDTLNRHHKITHTNAGDFG